MRQPLGSTLSVHRGELGAGGWLWYVGGILVLSFFANAAKGDMALAVGSLGGAVMFLIVPIMRWRQSLEIFEQGFVWKRLIGSKVVRKEHVTGAKMTTHIRRSGQSVEVEIFLSNGGELSATGLSDPSRIVRTMNAWAEQGATDGSNDPDM